jgi:proteasome lid subunit RPN8/RPN11
LSTPFRLQLPRSIAEEMAAQARAELPNECCGLLAGQVLPPDSFPSETGQDVPIRRVVRRYPLINSAKSPREYWSEARSMLAAEMDMRKRGLEILAVYHSHPTTEPVPSPTDRERNYSENVMNFIISLKAETPELQGWWLTALDYRPAEWEYIE